MYHMIRKESLTSMIKTFYSTRKFHFIRIADECKYNAVSKLMVGQTIFYRQGIQTSSAHHKQNASVPSECVYVYMIYCIEDKYARFPDHQRSLWKIRDHW